MFQACVKRIQGDETGHKHCTGQYFDYWSCIDKCVSFILHFQKQTCLIYCIGSAAEITVLENRLRQSYLWNWSNEEVVLWYIKIIFSSFVFNSNNCLVNFSLVPVPQLAILTKVFFLGYMHFLNFQDLELWSIKKRRDLWGSYLSNCVRFVVMLKGSVF